MKILTSAALASTGDWMMIYKWLLPLFLVAGPAWANEPDISVREAEFFSDRALANGFIESVATTNIPYEVGTSCYRWVIYVEPRRQMVPLQEVFRLPAPARQWGGVDGDPDTATSLDADRAGATTQLVDSIEDGELSNGWCVAEGDPQGPYSISVYRAETLLHRFDFTVGR